jgi:transcriptional antiterminator
MLLTRQEKEKLVLKLAEEGRTTRDIAKEVHISLKDIGKIIRKETGDDDIIEREKQKQEAEKEKLKRQKSLSPYARAFQMFKDKLSLADVAIELDIKTDTVLNFHSDYLRP